MNIISSSIPHLETQRRGELRQPQNIQHSTSKFVKQNDNRIPSSQTNHKNNANNNLNKQLCSNEVLNHNHSIPSLAVQAVLPHNRILRSCSNTSASLTSGTTMQNTFPYKNSFLNSSDKYFITSKLNGAMLRVSYGESIHPSFNDYLCQLVDLKTSSLTNRSSIFQKKRKSGSENFDSMEKKMINHNCLKKSSVSFIENNNDFPQKKENSCRTRNLKDDALNGLTYSQSSSFFLNGWPLSNFTISIEERLSKRQVCLLEAVLLSTGFARIHKLNVLNTLSDDTKDFLCVQATSLLLCEICMRPDERALGSTILKLLAEKLCFQMGSECSLQNCIYSSVLSAENGCSWSEHPSKSTHSSSESMPPPAPLQQTSKTLKSNVHPSPLNHNHDDVLMISIQVCKANKYAPKSQNYENHDFAIPGQLLGTAKHLKNQNRLKNETNKVLNETTDSSFMNKGITSSSISISPYFSALKWILHNLQGVFVLTMDMINMPGGIIELTRRSLHFQLHYERAYGDPDPDESSSIFHNWPSSQCALQEDFECRCFECKGRQRFIEINAITREQFFCRIKEFVNEAIPPHVIGDFARLRQSRESQSKLSSLAKNGIHSKRGTNKNTFRAEPYPK